MLINDLYRINKAGNMKFVSLRTEDTKSSLHIIYDKENNKLMAFKTIENKDIILPVDTSCISIDILSDAQNPLGYIDHNNPFKDYDSDALYIARGETFIDEFGDIYSSIYGVDVDIDEQFYIDPKQFVDDLFIHLYNKISEYNIIPVNQLFDMEFTIDENKIQHISQFQYFYRRMLDEDVDDTYENIWYRINKYREPREFNFINRVMRAQPGTIEICPIDFIMEFYYSVKYIKLLKYKKEKMEKELEVIVAVTNKMQGNN